MGAIYEVIHLETRRRRALKTMLPEIVLAVLRRAKRSMALVACVGVGACGGVSTHRSASGGTGGTASEPDGGGEVAMGGACDKAPLPSAGAPPGEIGCYAADIGGTWVRIPCNCELLLENSGREDAVATITLGVSDPSALTGSVAELDIPDPEYEFFDIWTRQAGGATVFFVSWEDGVTTVQLGVSSVVTLDAVPLRACESRPGALRFDGPTTAALEVQAAIVGPELENRVEGECRTIAHPTPSPG
jgi:hypothetical protein